MATTPTSSVANSRRRGVSDEIVDRECERLGIGGLRSLSDAESGAAMQRRVRRKHGNAALADVVRLSQ